MQIVSSHNGKLLKTDSTELGAARRSFSTGLQAIDDLLPAGVLGAAGNS